MSQSRPMSRYIKLSPAQTAQFSNVMQEKLIALMAQKCTALRLLLLLLSLHQLRKFNKRFKRKLKKHWNLSLKLKRLKRPRMSRKSKRIGALSL